MRQYCVSPLLKTAEYPLPNAQFAVSLNEVVVKLLTPRPIWVVVTTWVVTVVGLFEARAVRAPEHRDE